MSFYSDSSKENSSLIPLDPALVRQAAQECIKEIEQRRLKEREKDLLVEMERRNNKWLVKKGFKKAFSREDAEKWVDGTHDKAFIGHIIQENNSSYRIAYGYQYDLCQTFLKACSLIRPDEKIWLSIEDFEKIESFIDRDSGLDTTRVVNKLTDVDRAMLN